MHNTVEPGRPEQHMSSSATDNPDMHDHVVVGDGQQDTGIEVFRLGSSADRPRLMSLSINEKCATDKTALKSATADHGAANWLYFDKLHSNEVGIRRTSTNGVFCMKDVLVERLIMSSMEDPSHRYDCDTSNFLLIP